MEVEAIGHFIMLLKIVIYLDLKVMSILSTPFIHMFFLGFSSFML